jgi:hypothetical protein
MKRSFAAGSVYFAIIFALGFVLGSIRVLVTGPKLGGVAAVLLEIPIMLATSWFVARWCIALFSVRRGGTERLAMGSLAFSLLMLAELSLSTMLFGRTVSEHFATYAHVVGLIGLTGQLAFALIPFLQGRFGQLQLKNA